jgi:hypothetical protein
MRWSVWIAAASAVLISGTIASAQYYQSPFNQPYGVPGVPDIAASPRPDFPGAKQGQTAARHSHKHGNSNSASN